MLHKYPEGAGKVPQPKITGLLIRFFFLNPAVFSADHGMLSKSAGAGL